MDFRTREPDRLGNFQETINVTNLGNAVVNLLTKFFRTCVILSNILLFSSVFSRPGVE